MRDTKQVEWNREPVITNTAGLRQTLLRCWCAVGMVLFTLGFIGSFWSFGLALGIVDLAESRELPLGDVVDVGVDSNGSVYCALQFYSRIQVYDKVGRFIRGWHVDSCGGGAFRLDVDNSDQIHVGTARARYHHVYNERGTLLSTVRDPQAFDDYDKGIVRDRLNNRYEIRNKVLFPKVIVIDPAERSRILIKSPWYLWLVQAPFPLFLFLFGGVFSAAFAGWRLNQLPQPDCPD